MDLRKRRLNEYKKWKNVPQLDPRKKCLNWTQEKEDLPNKKWKKLSQVKCIYVKCITKTSLRPVCILALFQTPKFHPG